MNNLSYPCHGVHTNLPKGKASGNLVINEYSVQFEINGQIIKGSPEQLGIEIGGASDRLVFLTLEGKPDWRFYTADRSVLNNPSLRSVPALQLLLNTAKRKRRLNWSVTTAVSFAFICIPVFIVMKMDIVSELIAEQIPIEWEQKIGETGFAQYAISTEFLEQKQAQVLLDPIVTPLISAIDNKRFDYRFYIAGDTSINAFALPGGIVVINSGLILAANNAEELLGVVAHEISHVRDRHGLRNMISTAGGYLVISATLGDASGLLAMLANAAPLFIGQSYSRDFERAADKSGFNLLVKARINPQGLSAFFNKLLIKEQEIIDKLGADEYNESAQKAFALFSTHPATTKRIETLNAMQIPQQEYIDLSMEFAALKAATEKFVIDGDFNKSTDNTIESKQ